MVRGQKGKPCSARRPTEKSSEPQTTPPPKLSTYELPGIPSPPAVPKPMAKRQLTAAMKLENQLKQQPAHKKQKQEARDTHQPEESPEPARSKKQQKQKPEKKSEQDKKVKQKKAKRAPNNGPMQEAMNKFVQKKRSQGKTWAEARALWGTSAKRSAIIATLSESERRRRRF